MSNYPDNRNPFFDGDEDKSGFGGGSKAIGSSGTDWGSSFREISDDDFGKPINRAEYLQQQKQLSMNRTMESSQRAIASIYESERMGIATAEELMQQGEQLDNVERKTAAINQEMKTTQKSINSIKSVFGGIKNWWSGKKEEPKETVPANPRSERLQASVDNHRESNPHPAMRIRGDTSGFYDDGDSGFGGARSGGYSSEAHYGGGGQSSSSGRAEGGGYGQRQEQKSATLQEFDDQCDKNLDVMSDGMARLKLLAMGLGDEIEVQNDQIDRIGVQVERASHTINDQNKQMKGILGHKASKK